ncbi:protein bcn92 [Cimex lectularius]|uniref:Complex 1 LYR protein domain-containing protein n=1 Tax=Cimex lectularius TaxID=79782 RepID=A0A8I6RB32_CIMLE|nr:protein bcn92 [Cimex lectularius]
MPAPGKLQVLTLYKALLREASKFPAYNFRMYGLRRVRDGFKINKSITDEAKIIEKYEEGIKSLDIIKRQVVISSLFRTDTLVIEKMQ